MMKRKPRPAQRGPVPHLPGLAATVIAREAEDARADTQIAILKSQIDLQRRMIEATQRNATWQRELANLKARKMRVTQYSELADAYLTAGESAYALHQIEIESAQRQVDIMQAALDEMVKARFG